MDRVFLRRLRVEALIGVYEHERHAPQPLYLDLEMSADVARAAAEDRIEDALDYGTVARELRALAAASSYRLVETLAEACARHLQSRFGVRWLCLTLSKPGALAEAEAAGVTIERGRP